MQNPLLLHYDVIRRSRQSVLRVESRLRRHLTEEPVALALDLLLMVVRPAWLKDVLGAVGDDTLNHAIYLELAEWAEEIAANSWRDGPVENDDDWKFHMTVKPRVRLFDEFGEEYLPGDIRPRDFFASVHISHVPDVDKHYRLMFHADCDCCNGHITSVVESVCALPKYLFDEAVKPPKKQAKP